MRTGARLRGLFAAGLATVCLIAFFDTSKQYHGFELPQQGVYYIDTRELAVWIWYALWGSLAAGFLSYACWQTRIPSFLTQLAERAHEHSRALAWVAACSVLLLTLGVRFFVLQDQPVADDESTYVFEAQTLLQGRLSNPPPPQAAFYGNQFILLKPGAWYGKYPLGHPALLALGEAVSLRWLVVPLIAFCATLATFRVGRLFFSPARAALGALLLAVSPQFIGTQATQLSQPASALAMLLGLGFTLRALETPSLLFGLWAGLAWGAALIIRPMPGALFVAVVALTWICAWWRDPSARQRLLVSGLGALPGIALGCGLLLLSNWFMGGDATESGYSAAHGTHGLLKTLDGRISNSLGGALVRQNFWLFGWPLSLAFVLWARPRRRAALFWGMLGAVYAYRVLVPKTVVSTTGPIYVFEAVPLLALASADGLARASAWLASIRVKEAKGKLLSAALSACVVALCSFAPLQLRALSDNGTYRARIDLLLEEADLQGGEALIFANVLVAPERAVTWAYYPPNPAPDLKDRIIFVRFPRGPNSLAAVGAFWRNQYPERRAFIFDDSVIGGVSFRELEPGMKPGSLSVEAFLRGDAGSPP